MASEHPAFLPAAGAQFVASKVNAIAANPELWRSTVFILNYDENDGLFDHVPPPIPGRGTLAEYVTRTSPGGTPGSGLWIGAGFRVPCIIVSPWTVGGHVCTEAFDHTSVLQFLEQVTGVHEPNISAWRRRTFGDMTGAFGSRLMAAPSIPHSSASATTAELAFQQGQLAKGLPTPPGVKQIEPTQSPGSRHSIE